MEDNSPDIMPRHERREKKLRKKRQRIQKHGKNLARIYIDTIIKRLKRQSTDR